MKKSNANLCAFSGKKLNVIGKITVPVEYEGVVVRVVFQVVDKKAEFLTLLGRTGLDILCPNWRHAFVKKTENTKIEFVNKIVESGGEATEECGNMINMHSITQELKEEESDESLLKEVMKEFPTIFDGDLSQSITGYKAKVHLKENAVPVFAKPYGLPIRFEDRVKKELNKLVLEGVLTPTTSSRFASPMVVVEKADKKNIRICIDCKRTLNPQVINESFYPLPGQDSIFARMSTAKYFCVIDLKKAYLQLELSEESKEYVTMNTPFGLCQFNKLPFGVSAAPSIFQYVIDEIISGISLARAYLDNIIIGGETKKNVKQICGRY